MTTDRQAALAAAARLVATASLPNPQTVERVTLTMAGAFLRWLEGGPTTRPADDDADERLKPNVDFSSPTAATTTRLDPDAVMAAAAYVSSHRLDSAARTPSGKFACLCGQPWPCSMRLPETSADSATEALDLAGLRLHLRAERS